MLGDSSVQPAWRTPDLDQTKNTEGERLRAEGGLGVFSSALGEEVVIMGKPGGQ